MVNVHRGCVKIMQKMSPSRVLQEAEAIGSERQSLPLFNHQKYIKSIRNIKLPETFL